jgi:hypothetical protein
MVFVIRALTIGFFPRRTTPVVATCKIREHQGAGADASP